MFRISSLLGVLLLFLAPPAQNVAHAVQPGVYTLTLSPGGGDDASCGNVRGLEEVTVQDGVIRSSFISNLRLAVAPNGSVSGSGFEQMTGWGAPVKLTGKQTPAGYEGDLEAARFGHSCYGTWVLVRPTAAPRAGDAQTGTAKDDVQVRLKKLKQLFDDGLITKEEYEAKRKQLLDAL